MVLGKGEEYWLFIDAAVAADTLVKFGPFWNHLQIGQELTRYGSSVHTTSAYFQFNIL
jgi:hypothetical protein